MLLGTIVVLTILLSGRHRPAVTRAMFQLGTIGVVIFLIFGGIRDFRGAKVSVETPRVRIAPEMSSLVQNHDSDNEKLDNALPEWTRQAVRIDGQRKLVVISSGRFASEQEAELHGLQQAAVVAAKEYSSLDPRGIGAVAPEHPDLVKNLAIKRQFSEVAQHDFGKFQAPMYQRWLQIELTSELGDRIAAPWRQAVVEARLRLLAGIGLWATAATALSAFALRLDSAWKGRRRSAIVGAVIVLTLGSLALIA